MRVYSVGMRGFSLAITIAALARVVGAQEQRRLAQPDSIPFELAAALASSGSVGMDPQLLVGAFPEWVASRVALPPGARVLGSAFSGGGVVGIVAAPRNTSDSLLTRLKRDLLARGWHTPPPMPSYGGGFRSAAQAAALAGDLSRVTVCGDDQQMLSVSAVPHRGSEIVVTYRFLMAAGYPCKPPELPQGYVRSPLPTLFNPLGTTDASMGSCALNNIGYSGTNTAFRTPTMTADEILDRYARQLADSGWKSEGAKASIVGGIWTRPDSAGAPVQVSLYVTTGRDSTCHEVNMQVRTLKKP